MRPCARGLLLAALLFNTTAHAVEGVAALDEQEALRASQAVIGRSVADHTLLDRDGRPLRLSSYRGKPLLVSFIYTGCFQVCPTQTRALHEAVKGLDAALGPQQYNVVSIGFNQPFDSPTAMRAFLYSAIVLGLPMSFSVESASMVPCHVRKSLALKLSLVTRFM